MRATTYRPENSTAWIVIDLPNIAAAFGSSLASATPGTGQAKLFAIGADAKVYSIDWDSSADWTTEKTWTEVAPNGKGIDALIAGGLAAVSRVNGQIEIYAQSKDRALVKAWWF